MKSLQRPHFCLSQKMVNVYFTHQTERNWPRGYKTFFMLNSSEHEIFPALNC